MVYPSWDRYSSILQPDPLRDPWRHVWQTWQGDPLQASHIDDARVVSPARRLQQSDGPTWLVLRPRTRWPTSPCGLPCYRPLDSRGHTCRAAGCLPQAYVPWRDRICPGITCLWTTCSRAWIPCASTRIFYAGPSCCHCYTTMNKASKGNDQPYQL